MAAGVQVKRVQVVACQAKSEIAADAVQVKQIAATLGLKGKGSRADLIEQIMKTRSK